MKILCLGDIHVGSRLAPWPQEYPLEDGIEVLNSPQQRWLRECWRLMSEDVKRWKPDVVIVGGDVLEGIHPDNGELITNNAHEQQGAAVELLAALIPRRAEVFFVKGTPRHEGLMSSLATAVARELHAKPTDGGTYVRHNLLLDTPAGLLFAVHHTSGGSLPWTAGSGSQRGYWLLKMALADTFGLDFAAVKALLTWHVHTSSVNSPTPGALVMSNPCWQLKTAYGHKRLPYSWPDIGYGKVEATADGFSGRCVTFRPPMVEVEKVEPGNRSSRSKRRPDPS
jgi:hypothetical protein